MKVPMTPALRNKIMAALLVAGVGGPSAYIASNLTVESEGMLTHLYLDPVGLETACVGHLMKKGEVRKKSYTVDECIDMFVKDWKEHEELTDRYVRVPYRSGWMKGALTDFTFNKGVGAFSKSTLLRKLNSRDYDGACMELTKWVYGTVNGKKVVLKGLEIRATSQYKYCMGEVPKDYTPTMNYSQYLQ